MRVDGTPNLQRLNPGLLRHRITIQQRSVSGQDAVGADIYTYADVMTCYAAKEMLRGRELEAAMQRWSDVRHKWIIPYDSRVTSTAMVINDNGTRLDILDIADPFGQQDRLEILAREVK